MSESKFNWVDNPTASGQAICDTDILNECLMHLKYNNAGGGGLEIGDIGFTQMAIDESKGKRRKLNGQLIIQEQYPQFTNIVKNSVALNSDLACTEAEWQTELTMSANGVCYKYVIDDEAGTIRLPKYPDYLDLSINGAKTVSVYGTGKTLGFTDGSLEMGSMVYGQNLYVRTTLAEKNVGVVESGSGSTANNTVVGVSKNASKSGLTGSVTTSSEKIKGTYFIQVATGAETEDNIINEIELNNPFSLLDYKYSEYELNNLSWLRSEGQYNSKAVYPAVYELLLKIYNGTETKAGVSVKLTTETFTDYDFVLNTNDETFRLPIKVKQKFFNSGDVPVVGNGLPLEITNGSTSFNIGTFNNQLSSNGAYLATVDTGHSIGDTNISPNGNYKKVIGISTNPAKSGLVAKLSSTEVSDLYLYFYVGETVQNANLVNIGRIQEQYTTKSMVDGQVEVVNQTLASNVSLSNTIHTYDLSGYIPNDGYNYEIQVGITGATSATSGAGIEIRMGTDISPLGCGFVCSNMPRSNAAVTLAGNINLVVGAERKLYLQNSSSSSSFSLTFLRLGTRRRLGTNL